MDIKTFKTAEELVKKIGDYEEVLKKLDKGDCSIDWMRIVVNTTDSESGADIDCTIFANSDENKEISRKVLDLMKTYFSEKLEEAMLKLEEL